MPDSYLVVISALLMAVSVLIFIVGVVLVSAYAVLDSLAFFRFFKDSSANRNIHAVLGFMEKYFPRLLIISILGTAGSLIMLILREEFGSATDYLGVWVFIAGIGVWALAALPQVYGIGVGIPLLIIYALLKLFTGSFKNLNKKAKRIIYGYIAFIDMWNPKFFRFYLMSMVTTAVLGGILVLLLTTHPEFTGFFGD